MIDVGGLLGIGERQVAVDMPSTGFVSDDATPEELSHYFLVSNASRVIVEAVPEYANYRVTDTAVTEASDSMKLKNLVATDDTRRDPMVREGYPPATPEQMTTKMMTGGHCL